MDIFKVLTRLVAPHIPLLDNVNYPKEMFAGRQNMNMSFCINVYNHLFCFVHLCNVTVSTQKIEMSSGYVTKKRAYRILMKHNTSFEKNCIMPNVNKSTAYVTNTQFPLGFVFNQARLI